MFPIHPIVVHFPIALVVMSAIFFSLDFITGNERWGITGFWVLVGAAVGSVGSIITGNMAYLSLILTNELRKISELHEILGWTAAWLIFVLLTWYYLRKGKQLRIEKFAFLFVIYMGSGITVFSAWLGGTMVYGKGAGVMPMEEILKQKKEKEESANGSTVSYELMIDD